MAHPALCRRVFRFPDKESGSRYSSRRMVNVIRDNPFSILGLATGRSVELHYRYSVESLLAVPADVSNVTTYNMDEHLDAQFHPVPVSHPLSYRGYMQQHFHGRLPFDPAKLYFPEPVGPGPHAVGNFLPHYTRMIQARGIDFQLAGIGPEGHFAFNEANECDQKSPSRIVRLAQSTIIANAPLAGGDLAAVPPNAGTIGFLELLEMTRELWVLAWGLGKAPAVRDAIEGPVSAACPGSFARWPYHRNVVWVLDFESSSLLKETEIIDLQVAA
jgi:glucosamine-6-phosphate deaminase